VTWNYSRWPELPPPSTSPVGQTAMSSSPSPSAMATAVTCQSFVTVTVTGTNDAPTITQD
jgi:hypothetical protein